MSITDGPWFVSSAHPQTGMYIITNGQGQVIAGHVPNKDDAFLICQAREAHPMDVTVSVNWKAFGKQVRAARKALRESQDVAAKMCGISRNYMSMIERGTAIDPSYTIILTLCRWLRLEMPQ